MQGEVNEEYISTMHKVIHYTDKIAKENAKVLAISEAEFHFKQALSFLNSLLQRVTSQVGFVFNGILLLM
jgi:hypothetical protein